MKTFAQSLSNLSTKTEANRPQLQVVSQPRSQDSGNGFVQSEARSFDAFCAEKKGVEKLNPQEIAAYFDNRFIWLAYKELLDRKASALPTFSDAMLAKILQGDVTLISKLNMSIWQQMAFKLEKFFAKSSEKK